MQVETTIKRSTPRIEWRLGSYSLPSLGQLGSSIETMLVESVNI